MSKLCLLLFFLLRANPLWSQQSTLQHKDFKTIIENYTLVGDYKTKEAMRSVSPELFWRYPLIIPDTYFPVDFDFGDSEKELIATPGTGRAAEHMNRGRILFFEGKYRAARATWLSARARFGSTYPYHRRNDYYIGLGFIKLAKQRIDQYGENLNKDSLRVSYSNAATFLSWAFVRKKDLQDDFLDTVTSKGLYNMGAIYYRFQRYTGAHAAAVQGLNFLRKKGWVAYRPQLRRLIAETWIRAGNYVEAVKELDTSIRQDPNPYQAALAFARIGDVYFDLNNYELAEEVYAISQQINRGIDRLIPISFILRGESLFWMGQFSKAQKMLRMGIDSYSETMKSTQKEDTYMPYAFLRIADAYLARYAQEGATTFENPKAKHELLEKAKLEYFRVSHSYPKSRAARIAEIRRACLELPFYKGQNIKHARKTLKKAIKWELTIPTLELASACHIASLTQHERTERMLQEIASFYKKYPRSRFLKQFVEPVREYRASLINDYIDKKNHYLVIQYFEANKEKLFAKLNSKQKKGVFDAYIYSNMTTKAKDFWPEIYKRKGGDLDKIRKAVYLAEIDRLGQNSKVVARNIGHSRKLAKHTWSIKPTYEVVDYINRIQDSKLAVYHAEWMYELVKNWPPQGKKDYYCDIAYSLLSKWADSPTTVDSSKKVWQVTSKYIEDKFPELITKDKECAFAILDLEAKLGQQNNPDYASKWKDRLDWPKLPPVIGYIWLASEMLADINRKEDARALWTFLSENSPDDSPEKSLAILRLDNSRTEYDNLWRQ